VRKVGSVMDKHYRK